MRVRNTFGLNPVLNSEYFIPLMFLMFHCTILHACQECAGKYMYSACTCKTVTEIVHPCTLHGRNKLCHIVQNFHGAKFLQIGKMQNFATTKCLVIVLVTSTTKYFMKNIFVNAIQLVKFTKILLSEYFVSYSSCFALDTKVS